MCFFVCLFVCLLVCLVVCLVVWLKALRSYKVTKHLKYEDWMMRYCICCDVYIHT